MKSHYINKSWGSTLDIILEVDSKNLGQKMTACFQAVYPESTFQAYTYFTQIPVQSVHGLHALGVKKNTFSVNFLLDFFPRRVKVIEKK